jgi:ribosome-associated protein
MAVPSVSRLVGVPPAERDGELPGANGLRVNRSLVLPPEELRWRYRTSGGPGGQHANRSRTAVEVSFDVERSTVLGPRQRARLLYRLGPLVTASSSDERSQLRNRERAAERLAERLRNALAVPRARVATAPTKAAKRRRVEDKRRRGELKRQRRADPFA